MNYTTLQGERFELASLPLVAQRFLWEHLQHTAPCARWRPQPDCEICGGQQKLRVHQFNSDDDRLLCKYLHDTTYQLQFGYLIARWPVPITQEQLVFGPVGAMLWDNFHRHELKHNNPIPDPVWGVPIILQPGNLTVDGCGQLETTPTRVGLYLTYLRVLHYPMTERRLARVLGIDVATLAQLELGQLAPHEDHLLAYHQAFPRHFDANRLLELRLADKTTPFSDQHRLELFHQLMREHSRTPDGAPLPLEEGLPKSGKAWSSIGRCKTRGGVYLTTVRIRSKLSQRDLAERLGMIESHLCRTEKGVTIPTLQRLLEYRRIAPDYFDANRLLELLAADQNTAPTVEERIELAQQLLAR